MTPELIEKKKKIVEYFINKKVLITKDIIKKLDDESELERTYTNIFSVEERNLSKPVKYNVKRLSNYEIISKKYTTQDFVGYFNVRYKILEKILQKRQELQNLTSIARILQKGDKEVVSFIGMVYGKHTTKKENIVLTLEDQTGSIKAIINKNSPIFAYVKDIVFDEVIGVAGICSEDVVFVNNIIFPDVPITQELKKSPEEVYAAVVSDIHIGSVYFLEDEFDKFIKWIRGEVGNDEQKRISELTKYVFIVGDLVDGIGIYPKQDQELKIKDIYQQYDEFIKCVYKIPDDKQIIICAGNHDACRLSEPQPRISAEYLKDLEKLPNVTILTNPCYVNIHSSENFPGFDFLLYHGYSYDYYGDTVESIRTSGRSISDRTELIMKYLLQKRHLAPSHSSTLYIPDAKQDVLAIEKIPDFFLSGHIHKSCIGNYRGTIIVSGSCFQAKTSFQEKVGHEPEPCKIPLINLQTRKITIMNFSK